MLPTHHSSICNESNHFIQCVRQSLLEGCVWFLLRLKQKELEKSNIGVFLPSVYNMPKSRFAGSTENQSSLFKKYWRDVYCELDVLSVIAKVLSACSATEAAAERMRGKVKSPKKCFPPWKPGFLLFQKDYRL